MLQAASAGSLDLYEEGIRVLHLLYPNSWSDLLLADEEMRFEHWDRMYETLTEGADDDELLPADFNEDRPWDYIICQSAFELGVNNMGAPWWQMNIVAGLNSPQSTQSVIARLVGRGSQAAFPGRPEKISPPPHREPAAPQPSGKLCKKWNKGHCSWKRCPDNKLHQCSKCGQPNHGANTCGRDLVQPVGKGAGKGKKSRK